MAIDLQPGNHQTGTSPGTSGTMTEHDIGRLVGRAARVGFSLNVLTPAVVAAIAFLLHRTGLVPTVYELPVDADILFYVLGILAVGELVTAFVIRKTLFAPARLREFRSDVPRTEQWVIKASAIVSAVGASPIVYGAVLYLLNGDLGQLAFFGIITLLAYRLLRPTPGFLRDALEIN